MSDMFLGSQAPMYQNVRICKRSKSGAILEERFAKNRITKLMLFGIARFLLGHFNDSSPDKIDEVIPRYLALGTNTPSGEGITDVGLTSSVNDSRLLNELKYSSTIGGTETIKRIWIAERNMCKLNSSFNDPFIKISIKTYVSDSVYNGLKIGEAGLFSKEKDNNCLARVCFEPITKNEGEVLDIQWDITLLSYGETKYPETLSMENGSKIVLPLKYTDKKFKEIKLGLSRINNELVSTQQIFVDNNNDDPNNTISNVIFFIDESGKLYGVLNTTRDDNGNVIDYEKVDRLNDSHVKQFITKLKITDWYLKLKRDYEEFIQKDTENSRDNFDKLFEKLIDILLDSVLDNTSDKAYYLYSYRLSDETVRMVTPFYFGNSRINNDEDIEYNELAMSLLFSDDKSYVYEDTGARYILEGSEYKITDKEGKELDYKVINNQFYKKNNYSSNTDYWSPTNYHMYNGLVVDDELNLLGYSYSNNAFYKYDETVIEVLTNQYINYSGISKNQNWKLFSIDKYNNIIDLNYYVDFNDGKKLYSYNKETGQNEYISFHISKDNYIVDGEYMKLIPIITPSDATDKSISWVIQNPQVAKINQNGVVTAWDIGETSAIASTTNELRHATIVEVIKSNKYVEVEQINMNPTEVTFNLNSEIEEEFIISATVAPIISTNSTLTWMLDNDISRCVDLIRLGNNKVKIVLNNSGNIGVGYLIATAQSGKSAYCLIRVTMNSENLNCDDESHLIQEGGVNYGFI